MIVYSTVDIMTYVLLFCYIKKLKMTGGHSSDYDAGNTSAHAYTTALTPCTDLNRNKKMQGISSSR